MNSLKEDEDRARDQLVEIKEILAHSKEKVNSYKLPIIPKEYEPKYKVIKTINPSEEEVNINNRARSAKLRVIKRIG